MKCKPINFKWLSLVNEQYYLLAPRHGAMVIYFPSKHRHCNFITVLSTVIVWCTITTFCFPSELVPTSHN